MFRNGVPVDYNGPRQADGIVSYMNKQQLPAVSDITPDNHDEFTKADKIVVIAYGDDKHPIPESFTKYANTARDKFVFGQLVGDKIPKLPGNPKLPAIVLYKSFDEGHNVLEDKDIKSLSEKDLGDFVAANSVPLFAELGPDNFATYAESGKKLALLFADPNDAEPREKLIEGLKETAREVRDKLNFVWIDGVKFGEYGKQLGVATEKLPAFAIQDLTEMLKYVQSEVASIDSIKKHVKGVISGAIKPTVKSEPTPEAQDGAVYKLVANDWETLFDNKDKDVFVEFYAPWCGHCQRLAPIWESLGEKYKPDNVVIAQMDATENDIPPAAPFKVQGFPTLKFKPAGSDEFLDYNGDRSLESLTEFVEANRKSKATGNASETADAKEPEVEAEAVEVDEDEHAHDEL